MSILPIEAILPSLQEALRAGSGAVLVAPPGAGKTTRVPLTLINEPWLDGKRVLMLEPRRLAARAAARFMAGLLKEKIGDTVGYRIRQDTRVGPKTRIEVITEGVLTRMLQADPALDGVGAVILDEFHERSLQADLGLALLLQSQALLRPDLRILIMSATLDAEPVAALLGGVPVLVSEGRQFPVETHYLEPRSGQRNEDAVIAAVHQAVADHEGDILVFLPGAGEIRRTAAGLHRLALGDNIRIAPLYGNLSQQAQDEAIAPSPAGCRKIVLATSIAQTSLTVEGVRIIVDSGLMRVPRFSPKTGMTRLETVAVSRAAADQRRGRAGRLGPGVCYRLWSAREDSRLAAQTVPEILEADLASLVLELAVWGVKDAAELLWLDAPPLPAFAQARELLIQLGALASNGLVTPHGRQMAEAGIHPRLAHMIIKAKDRGLGELACELAAILTGRDAYSVANAFTDADLRHRVEALGSRDYHQVLREANHLKKEFGILPAGKKNPEDTGLLLALAFPDRVAQRRDNGRYLMQSGRGAMLAGEQSLRNELYIVAAELDDQGTDSRIFLAAPVALAAIKNIFADQIEGIAIVEWENEAQAVRARQQERLGALVLKEHPLANPNPADVLAALLRGIASQGLGILPWTRPAVQLCQRIRFMHELEAAWPDVSETQLLLTLDEWLAPYIYGMSSRSELQRLNLVSVLEDLLTWEQRRILDEAAPAYITVPSGRRIPVDYHDPGNPVLAVRLQEMFGLEDTPRVACGRVPLTLHLLSPAQRPVQMTKDLASFWRSGYFEVRKDLLGRYPKHYWPDDPLAAMPTHRVRPGR